MKFHVYHHLSPELMGWLQGHFKRLEKLIMATKDELQQKMDALKGEVQKETDLVAAAKTALDGNTALIGNLQQQIQQLQQAGASAITQADLDALAQEAGDTLAVAQQNNASLAAMVPQNTAAASTTDQPAQPSS